MSRHRECDANCGCADPIANPPAREPDRIELGLRAAMAIKAENAGLYRQRAQFTKPRPTMDAAEARRTVPHPLQRWHGVSHDVVAFRVGGGRMTRNEELAEVIRLACQVESRTNVEQRALVALAWDCDIEHNKLTVTNRALKQPDWEPQDLVSLVLTSRVLGDGDSEAPAPKGWAKRWATWERDRCLVKHYR